MVLKCCLSAQGVFAKKIIQVRTKFGPLHAPVKERRKSTPPSQETVTNGDLGVGSVRPQGSLAGQGDLNAGQMSGNVTAIQEAALDQNNMEHQDIVQQALGIVKVTPQHMMGDDLHQGHPGPYGDVVTTLANSLSQPAMSDTVNLMNPLAGGDMANAQYAAGHITDDFAASLDKAIAAAVTEGLVQQQVLGLPTQNHQPINTTFPSQLGTTGHMTLPVVEGTPVKVLTNSVQPAEAKKPEERVKPNPADQPFELKVTLFQLYVLLDFIFKFIHFK